MNPFKVGDYVTVIEIRKTHYVRQQFLELNLDVDGVHLIEGIDSSQSVLIEGDEISWTIEMFEKVEVSSSLGDLL